MWRWPMADGAARPTLGAIRAVTYAVPDLAAIEAAYVGELGYVIVARGEVGEGQARAWHAPATAGRRTLVLGPASGEAVHLRFVESAAAAGWRALKTFGWNATEFVIQDLDALAARLDGGAFTVIGPPKGLSRFPMIRAMQAIGPAGECCYFTQVGPGSGLDLARPLFPSLAEFSSSWPPGLTPTRSSRHTPDSPIRWKRRWRPR